MSLGRNPPLSTFFVLVQFGADVSAYHIGPLQKGAVSPIMYQCRYVKSFGKFKKTKSEEYVTIRPCDRFKCWQGICRQNRKRSRGYYPLDPREGFWDTSGIRQKLN